MLRLREEVRACEESPDCLPCRAGPRPLRTGPLQARSSRLAGATVILAFGKGESANQNVDSDSGGGRPTVHALAVAVSSSGKITSSPASLDVCERPPGAAPRRGG